MNLTQRTRRIDDIIITPKRRRNVLALMMTIASCARWVTLRRWPLNAKPNWARNVYKAVCVYNGWTCGCKYMINKHLLWHAWSYTSLYMYFYKLYMYNCSKMFSFLLKMGQVLTIIITLLTAVFLLLDRNVSLSLRDAKWRRRTLSALFQVMACFLSGKNRCPNAE